MLVFNERTGEFEEQLGPGEKPSKPSIGGTSRSSHSSSTSSPSYNSSNGHVNRNFVKKAVYGILSDILFVDVDEIDEDSYLQDDLGADSLDAQEIIERVEDMFDIIVLDEEAEDIETVEEMIDYICDEVELYSDDDEDEDEDDEWDDDEDDYDFDDDDDWDPDEEEDTPEVKDTIDGIVGKVLNHLNNGTVREEIEKLRNLYGGLDWKGLFKR